MYLRDGVTPPPPGQIQHALFDFDGTLSLLRAGWQEVMTQYFDEVLASTSTSESAASRQQVCVDFITRLTGRQTIFQCMELADQVEKRGGTAQPAEDYKAEYLRRLHIHIEHRRTAIRQGGDPGPYLVPGTLELLDRLQAQGIRCYLASGTDVAYVREEADLLGVTRYFAEPGKPPRIYGALEDFRKFSKRMVIEQILTETRLEGSALIGFGDGYVEIEETLRAGGWAVGIASDETHVDGTAGDEAGTRVPGMDPWKQERLWEVGAHILTPNWLECDVLFDCLGVGID
ncbi:MAG: HAD hydrolase-like protein [Gemmatimonadetes bacterium]|jgi:phosphoglycolate phosphatase|nr:HAD hydrolase-like protein [Gemmatimonadota bacterium]MBT6144220.1 HAD hydrolase-like protein [Gemmatimonadota bacterium]MBT7859739.1 HAD hydrolase-like protein [Gemmatimonadota bacterium]